MSLTSVKPGSYNVPAICTRNFFSRISSIYDYYYYVCYYYCCCCCCNYRRRHHNHYQLLTILLLILLLPLLINIVVVVVVIIIIITTFIILLLLLVSSSFYYYIFIIKFTNSNVTDKIWEEYDSLVYYHFGQSYMSQFETVRNRILFVPDL